MSDFAETGKQFVNHFYGQFNQPREVSIIINQPIKPYILI